MSKVFKGTIFKDMTGTKWERLFVVERYPSNSKSGAKWVCYCECGNTTIVNGRNLRSGHTKSCGCLRKEVVSKMKRKG